MVSNFPLLFHAWTDLKYIFPDFLCRKVLPYTRVVLWCSGIFMIALPCMMGIWGPYIASSLLMSSVVIGHLLIWFFWMAYLKVCVDVHPTICCNILALSAPLISRMWNHDLLLSTVLRDVYYVVWSSENLHLLCQNSKDLPRIA